MCNPKMQNLTKTLHEYKSDVDGRHSYKMTSVEKKEVGLNVHANNFPFKQQFVA